MSFFAEAMHSLHPDVVWKQEGDDPTNESEFNSRVSVQTGKTGSLAEFEDSISTTNIKWNDVSTEMGKFQDAFNAQEYARNRQAEFPSIPDQLDEIYHNGIDSWKAVIKVTKDKYPK